jgi:copper ion binding protein
VIREYAVIGMSCEHCVRAVREEVGRVPGVGEVQVDLPAGRVRVEGEVSELAVRRAIAEAGYEVAP